MPTSVTLKMGKQFCLADSGGVSQKEVQNGRLWVVYTQISWQGKNHEVVASLKTQNSSAGYSKGEKNARLQAKITYLDKLAPTNLLRHKIDS